MSFLLLIRGDVYRQGRSTISSENTNKEEQRDTFVSMVPCLIQPAEEAGFHVSVIMDVCCIEPLRKRILSEAKDIFGDRLIKAEAHHERNNDAQGYSMIEMLDRNKHDIMQYEHVMIVRGDVLWKQALPLSTSMNKQDILFLARMTTTWGKDVCLNDVLMLFPCGRAEEYINWWITKKGGPDNTNPKHYSSPHLAHAMMPNVETILKCPIHANTAHMCNPFYRIIGRHEATKEETVTFFLTKTIPSYREPAANLLYRRKETVP
jgi:hypothetical protein